MKTTVVCAILFQGSRVLAAQRGETQSQSGLWEFPGGKVEAGESYSEALIREIREELLCEVEPLEELPLFDGDYPIQLIPLRCRLLRGEPRPLEHQALRWCGREELENLEWSDPDIPVVDYLSRNWDLFSE